jgi:hypothetical protein
VPKPRTQPVKGGDLLKPEFWGFLQDLLSALSEYTAGRHCVVDPDNQLRAHQTETHPSTVPDFDDGNGLLLSLL